MSSAAFFIVVLLLSEVFRPEPDIEGRRGIFTPGTKRPVPDPLPLFGVEEDPSIAELDSQNPYSLDTIQ